MYAFAIYIVDSSIDNKICGKDGQVKTTAEEGKCTGAADGRKLSKAFDGSHATSTAKVDAHTSKTIFILG